MTANIYTALQGTIKSLRNTPKKASNNLYEDYIIKNGKSEILLKIKDIAVKKES